MLKAVFLDVDNTLLDFDKCAKFAIEKSAAEFGFSSSDTLINTFNSMNHRLWTEIENGTLTKQQLRLTRWNRIFEIENIKADGVAFEDRFVYYLAQNAEPIDGATELLKHLSKKYIVCIASNAPVYQQQKRLKDSGMLSFVDHLFISEQIGFEKPNKQFFDYCFSKLQGISPSQTILIGDSLTADISGGIQYGMKVGWFNPNSKPIPESMKIDYIFKNLYEACKVL